MACSTQLLENLISKVDIINQLYHRYDKLEIVTESQSQKLRVKYSLKGGESDFLTGYKTPVEMEDYLTNFKNEFCLDPNRLDKFFKITPETRIISIDLLNPIRTRAKGIKNAMQYMQASYKGSYDKRAPLSVAPSQKQEDLYDILDGNSTWHVAKKIGMKALPITIKIK